MATADLIRTLLIVDITVLALFALLYLWQRRMSRMQLLGWSVLALVVPVIGPFTVIASRPGEWNPDFSFVGGVKRFIGFAQRLLPTEPKMSRSQRVRMRRQQQRQLKG